MAEIELPVADDIDNLETNEWIDALDSVIDQEGSHRAQFLIQSLIDDAYQSGVRIPYRSTTPYCNTIPVEDEPEFPGDRDMERRILALTRWNAIAMVLHAGKKNAELGGHIASYQSSASIYEVGFNHFFRGPDAENGGDLLFIQGHSSPGIYARAFLEGRLSEAQLRNFRQEAFADGLSSYPHPWLMPDFWQFPTVSMGLGPIQAIYQARFLKYLQNRGLANTEGRKVYCFCGDGEMDEPESLGCISLAAREGLDNLIFVINCNLQRLDGPVRGNASIIQELEGVFRGAGWNVIKTIWGRHWDPLFAKDKDGLLLKRMEECVDGDYQNYKARDGAYVREHFFGKYPELKAMVANMSDDEIWHLNRGGHDPIKIYAAYHNAVNTKGQPSVILAKTVKGYGMGAAGEGQNITHQQKKMSIEDLRAFRDRFHIPIDDDKIESIPFYRPADDSEEMQYLKQRRQALGGSMPTRRVKASNSFTIPPLSDYESHLKGTGEREISSTMAFVRFLNTLLKDKNFGKHIVPVVPDECRTFGMEGMFRQFGIYSPKGQLYSPVDSDQVMFYKEDKAGQMFEEGINEAGAFASWMSAATSYSNNDCPMIPFYIYYSMFGFQRIGDLAWAAGDIQARGFLIGGTAGRTTLNGEGLQHQDGHSLLLASTIPNCIAYDPTYAYEMAVIVHHGLKRMIENQDNVYFYITAMNENYSHPDMPKGAEEGIIKGLYQLHKAAKAKHQVTLLGSGTILREVERAAELLKAYDVGCDIWSVTSYNELRRDALAIARENHFQIDAKAKQSYVEQCLGKVTTPIIAASDYMRAVAEQIREFIPADYTVLGTDGYGRSDSRENLRQFFEVSAEYIAFAAMRRLQLTGKVDASQVKKAMQAWKLDPNKANPTTV